MLPTTARCESRCSGAESTAGFLDSKVLASKLFLFVSRYDKTPTPAVIKPKTMPATVATDVIDSVLIIGCSSNQYRRFLNEPSYNSCREADRVISGRRFVDFEILMLNGALALLATALRYSLDWSRLRLTAASRMALEE
jgi:hypothetical protein